ncbi:MAG: ChrR family anti-sigma-E factor [Xanthobacteraceae bacterium]
MIITHHPNDTTLAAFASGTLDEARALVVATHLSLCAECRHAVRAFEQIGGALLEELDPADMSAGALERATARLERPETTVPMARRTATDRLPAPLAQYELGSWRWIGRGVQWRPVTVSSEDGCRVFMLKAAPGIRLPRHRHTGTEWTCVFEGAFRHDLGRFGPGDFDEADESVEHNPSVEDQVPCICLVALQGSIQLQNWMGRLLQPLIRL